MPNTYRIAVDAESTPPQATLIDEAGIAVATTPILGDSEGVEIKAWAQGAAEVHEATLAQKQAEVDAAAAAASAAAAKVESLRATLEAEVIVIDSEKKPA